MMNKKEIYEQDKIEQMNNLANSMLNITMKNRSEYISNATISVLAEKDRRRHHMEKIAKSERLCMICGIEYYTDISTTCPLCELKRLLLRSITKKQFDNDGIVNSTAECVTRDNGGNSKSLENELHKINNYKYGDVVKIGKFHGEPIEWMILEVTIDRMFLLSKKILEIKSYNNSEWGACTWENCSLRKYLNNEFVGESFSTEEKSKIAQVKIKNDDNKEYGITGGNNTTDSIFCLSMDEVKKYIRNDSERIAFPTEYVKKKAETVLKWWNMQSFLDDKTGGGRWWLRSPGDNRQCAVNVSGSGLVVVYGDRVDSAYVGVRPALWMNI